MEPDAGPGRELPSVAVVVPTAGGRSALVSEVLHAVLADDATTELLVVLDGEDSATREMLEHVLDARLTVLEFSASDPVHHRGQEARDHGARAATSDVILALDDDVVPGAGLVTGHARRHLDGRDLVVVGYMPVVAHDPTAAVRLYARDYLRACATFERDPRTILDGLWAGNFSVRRAHWLRAIEDPLMDAGYHGDREFGLRLRAVGLEGTFDRRLRAEHRYARTVPGLIRDAEMSAVSRARLEPIDGDAARAQPPGAAADWLIEVLQRPGSRRIVFAALSHAARAAGFAGLRPLEDRLTSLLYSLAWHRMQRTLRAASGASPSATSAAPTR